MLQKPMQSFLSDTPDLMSPRPESEITHPGYAPRFKGKNPNLPIDPADPSSLGANMMSPLAFLGLGSLIGSGFGKKKKGGSSMDQMMPLMMMMMMGGGGMGG